MSNFNSHTDTGTLLDNEKYTIISCFHCGEDCPDRSISYEDKYFCCQGCFSVYQLLNKIGLCNYYTYNNNAGNNMRQTIRNNKFAYLDNNDIQSKLINFRQGHQAHVTFYIPYIHCSSCIYLLEHLPKILHGVIRSDIQFLKKEVSIVFDDSITSLRHVVTTLAQIGYEPHISLQHLDKKKTTLDRSLIYKLGVAGFCAGNIMLLSFPEYFSNNVAQEKYLSHIFRYLNLILSLPVFFYCSSIFFKSAWAGLKHLHMNVDFPVALAIFAIFVRSIVDVFFLEGSGYFDAMAGVVFFMLAGRVLQDKTYASLSFDRDYTDYFPIAATVLKDEKEVPTPLPKIRVDDILKIHNNEIIPSDGILSKGKAQIDYSFVTGESAPITIETGEIIYAGGKQLGGNIEIMVVKEVAQSYLTGLWNREKDRKTTKHPDNSNSFVHTLARNFTWLVLLIATVSGIYWAIVDPSKIWPSVTAVLIIACPCALLLTATFTNGYLIRILSRNGLFLRHAHIIEPFGKIAHVVFDKTGTLTSAETIIATFCGQPLSENESNWVHAITIPTTHVFSKPIKDIIKSTETFPVINFKEYPGLGVEGTVAGHHIKIGTASFMNKTVLPKNIKGTLLFLTIDDLERGYFEIQQGLRPGIKDMLKSMQQKISSSLISGDQPHMYPIFRQLLGDKTTLLFLQSPKDKLNYIERLQENGNIVAMVGDGLNDAGALMQSDIGICVAEHINNFTPAGDAIIEGKKLHKLGKFIKLCAHSKNIIRFCFGFSVLYNLIGLYFAVQGLLSPLIAAILMPSSTLTIITITYLLSNFRAKRLSLNK